MKSLVSWHDILLLSNELGNDLVGSDKWLINCRVTKTVKCDKGISIIGLSVASQMVDDVYIRCPLLCDLPPHTLDPLSHSIQGNLTISVSYNMESSVLAILVKDVLNETWTLNSPFEPPKDLNILCTLRVVWHIVRDVKSSPHIWPI